MVNKSDELQDELLRAAMSFLEHSGTNGQSILVNLPGGFKLGLEMEILRLNERLPAGRETAPALAPMPVGASRVLSRSNPV